MTICPCCGFKLNGILRQGCVACGAVPVGEPLPRPDHELPSYGRSLVITVMGLGMLLMFLTQAAMALLKQPPASFELSAWVDAIEAAAQTAAWRLKWIAIPATIIVLWASRKIYRSMLREPSRFCGLRYARCGLMTSATVPLLIAVLIGVTIPKRLRDRQDGIEAGVQAVGRTFDRAFSEYRQKYGKLPIDMNDLRVLPDPDGSIAAALDSFKPEWLATAYKPSADLAAKQQPVTLRGAVIRNAAVSNGSEEPLSDGLTLTNYTLRLPGADNLMGNEDDWIVRDGLIKRASETVRRPGDPTTSTATITP